MRRASTPIAQHRWAAAYGPLRSQGRRYVGVAQQNRLCMRRFAPRTPGLTPDNDPIARAVRRVRAECRAGCDHRAGATLAAEARRVPADAVAAGQSAARRARSTCTIRARRSASIIRPAPPSAARCSIPTTISRSWISCARTRLPAACSSMSAPMSAPMPWCWRVMSARDGKVIAIEPHPVTHARLAFNNAASGYTPDAGWWRPPPALPTAN